MQFNKTGFIVICKEPDEYEGYFASMVDDGMLTSDIGEAEIFKTEREAKIFISDYDDPEKYTYKPIDVVYTIKDLKLS